MRGMRTAILHYTSYGRGEWLSYPLRDADCLERERAEAQGTERSAFAAAGNAGGDCGAVGSEGQWLNKCGR